MAGTVRVLHHDQSGAEGGVEIVFAEGGFAVEGKALHEILGTPVLVVHNGEELFYLIAYLISLIAYLIAWVRDKV